MACEWSVPSVEEEAEVGRVGRQAAVYLRKARKTGKLVGLSQKYGVSLVIQSEEGKKSGRVAPARVEEETEEKEPDESSLRTLRSLLMRYPKAEWEKVREAGLEWSGRPLRGRRPDGLLTKRLERWTDDTASSADSSLFTSTGVWTSPYTWKIAAATATVLTIVNGTLILVPWAASGWSLQGFANGQTGHVREGRRLILIGARIMGLIFLIPVPGVGVYSYVGRRDLAKRSMLVVSFGVFVVHVLYVLGDILMKAWFPYLTISAANLLLFPAVPAALVYRPEKSFWALFGGGFCIAFSNGFLRLIAYFTTPVKDRLFTILYLCGAGLAFHYGRIFYRKRIIALAEAEAMAEADRVRYAQVWTALLEEDAAFREGLADLTGAWRDAQDHYAERRAKSQPNVDTVQDLFDQADLLNPLLQAKAASWAAQTPGCVHHRADVKAEERALQKVFRSYNEDWRCLCDLVRSTLTFQTPQQIAQCLRMVARDPDVRLLYTSDAKHRLRADFDPPAGYRDLQLSVRLVTQAAKDRRVSEHIAEIQFNLESFYALKSDEGHRNYVRARNRRGD